MIPDETSWECEDCGAFNIENGVIKDGKMYCGDCWNKNLSGDL